MLAFIIRRALQAVGVLLAIGIIAFAMFRFAGDPVNQMVGAETPPEERLALREQLGLNAPVAVQFGRYLANAARYEFGVSYQFRQPVSQLLSERMPATLELALCATVFALVFGILMGVYSALNRESALAKLFQAISLIGVSLPTFLIGILLIYLFAVTLGWLPSFGRGETVRLGWWTTGLLTWSGIKALIMPSITLGLFQMTLIMRLVRAEMLEVLRTDYIRFARARGLKTRAIHFGHAVEEHARAGHHHRGAAARLGHRIRDHHRDRVPVARHGTALRAGRADRRYPDHGGLSDAGRADLRGHQPRGRHPLHPGRPAPAPPDAPGGMSAVEDALSPAATAAALAAGGVPAAGGGPAAPTAALPGKPLSWSGAFLDSDVWASFKRSKLTMVAAATTVLLFLVAIFAGVISPQNPFDPGELDLLASRIPPLWDQGGQRPYLLGTDDQGRDMLSAIFYGLRISLIVGVLGVIFSRRSASGSASWRAMSGAPRTRSSCASPTSSSPFRRSSSRSSSTAS
jgi:peptide/nickel transport system permease protein